MAEYERKSHRHQTVIITTDFQCNFIDISRQYFEENQGLLCGLN